MRMDPDHYVDRNFYVEDIDIIYGRHHNPGFDRHATRCWGAEPIFAPQLVLTVCRTRARTSCSVTSISRIRCRIARLFAFGLRGGPENHMYGMRFENVRATTSVFLRAATFSHG
jgi:hypothetical protein